MTRAILLTGTLGSGKTAVAVEVAWLLSLRDVRVAVIDLDWLGWAHLGDEERPGRIDELVAANLAALRPNYAAAGVEHLVLARLLIRRAALEAVRAALPDAELTVVRLTASPATLAARLRRRDSGRELEEHLGEFQPYDALAAGVDSDAVVDNDGRPVSEVAEEVLRLAGW
jgi:adenylylsulfate kinase-like enzyme